MSETGVSQSSLIELTADITSAYVGNNRVAAEDLPALIMTVYGALNGMEAEPVIVVEPKVPAVSIKKSITDDFLICLEDGKKFKSLKRHLRTAYNQSPDEYRAKWGLPKDYPMVAPAYAASRSNLAKSMGLGQAGRVAKGAPKAAAEIKLGAKRGRPLGSKNAV